MKLSSLLFFLVILTIGSCRKEIASDQLITSAATVNKKSVDMNKELKIAVVSDIHFTSPDLFQQGGQNGQAFMLYLLQDPKILQYSVQIFDVVKESLIAQKPDLILMPGDLTKDGEELSHNGFVQILNEIQAELPDTKIYVVPGNHDINNPDAKMFIGDVASPAGTIQKQDFKRIYEKYGYNSVEQDASSLSYLAKPFEKLWVLGIDANKYEANTTASEVSGEIKASTLDWIEDILKDAKEQGATVLPMMHHNLLEHFAGESYLDYGYTIDNWETVTNQLLDAGMNIIFTGHYHANDITTYRHNGQELVDIETGSLVNPPLPYRMIMMKNKSLDVRTLYATLPGTYDNMNFTQYSTIYVTNLFAQRFAYFLAPYFGDDPTQVPTEITMLFANAYMAHYAGDEQLPASQRKAINQVSTMSPELGFMLNTLWTDINTKDNFGPITLQSR